ncbi:MAG: hypothetical protein P8048_15100 [Calditrichia bacterium]
MKLKTSTFSEIDKSGVYRELTGDGKTGGTIFSVYKWITGMG